MGKSGGNPNGSGDMIFCDIFDREGMSNTYEK